MLRHSTNFRIYLLFLKRLRFLLQHICIFRIFLIKFLVSLVIKIIGVYIEVLDSFWYSKINSFIKFKRCRSFLSSLLDRPNILLLFLKRKKIFWNKLPGNNKKCMLTQVQHSFNINFWPIRCRPECPICKMCNFKCEWQTATALQRIAKQRLQLKNSP